MAWIRVGTCLMIHDSWLRTVTESAGIPSLSNALTSFRFTTTLLCDGNSSPIVVNNQELPVLLSYQLLRGVIYSLVHLYTLPCSLAIFHLISKFVEKVWIKKLILKGCTPRDKDYSNYLNGSLDFSKWECLDKD